jgi:7-cyano-7-deazaguanine synthase
MIKKAIVVLSGGQDSTTCAFWAKDRGYELHAITFDYGQRHAIELEAAEKVGQLVGVKSHEFIILGSGILASTSPLVSKNELEQYANHSSLPGGLEKTFVPMRNQLFLTIAANRAYALGTNILVTGVCQEDNGGYPDCTNDFIEALEVASNFGTFTGVDGAPRGLTILTPLMNLTKAASVDLALRLPGCYEALAYSHTAYDGQYPPTGHDHASLLRAKGFEQAGVPDPLVLRAWHEGKMPLPASDNYSDELVESYSNVLGLLEGRP